MSVRFDNQAVLITGATGGIGVALADRFVSEGARVVLVGRPGSAVHGLAKSYGERALAIEADTHAALKKVIDWAGGLDVAVRCRGAGPHGAHDRADLGGLRPCHGHQRTRHVHLAHAAAAAHAATGRRRHGGGVVHRSPSGRAGRQHTWLSTSSRQMTPRRGHCGIEGPDANAGNAAVGGDGLQSLLGGALGCRVRPAGRCCAWR